MLEIRDPEQSRRAESGGFACAVLGEGILHREIGRALSASGTVHSQPGLNPEGLPADTAVLVAATDSWGTSGYPDIRKVCTERGVPWLTVHAELGTVVIGPLERPGIAGCLHCMELRRRRARSDPEGNASAWDQHRPAIAERPSSWLTGLASDTVAALVVHEVSLLTAGPATAQTWRATLHLDLENLTVSRHRFLPEPLCPVCGSLPADTAELAAITLVAHPKATPDTYRVRPTIRELDKLVDGYVDAETGLISALRRDTKGGLAIAAAVMPQRRGKHGEFGWGRSRSYRTSELIAILEALERYGGIEPGGKRTVTSGSYAELAGQALDPRTLGVHPAASYALPGFAFQPFDETVTTRWVWGYSFANAEPILVPEDVAYYRVPHDTPSERPFLYELSNGDAIGGCLEEAILYGILEVAERDAFLMTWYAQMPAPRIDLSSAHNRVVPLQAAAITAETGYEVLAFDTTLQQGIPCIWAMAVNPHDAGDAFKALSCAGSHLDPEHAVLNALGELGSILFSSVRSFPSETEHAHRLAADSSLVASMHDHSTLYGVADVFPRLDFLTGSPGMRTLPEMRAAVGSAFQHDDLTADLRQVIHRLVSAGMDVIVVDQTTPEHRHGGFACVKVLVPGALPMTFGHDYRRVDGLPRLLETPYQLGYCNHPLRYEEINPFPHPFP